MKSMNISLANKVAIVTGAFSGVGMAITRQFLECGVAGLVAVDQQPDIPEELRQCQEEFGSKLVFTRGDVRLEKTAEEFTRAAVDRFGRIEVLISNAGTSGVRAI